MILIQGGRPHDNVNPDVFIRRTYRPPEAHMSGWTFENSLSTGPPGGINGAWNLSSYSHPWHI